MNEWMNEWLWSSLRWQQMSHKSQAMNECLLLNEWMNEWMFVVIAAMATDAAQGKSRVMNEYVWLNKMNEWMNEWMNDWITTWLKKNPYWKTILQKSLKLLQIANFFTRWFRSRNDEEVHQNSQTSSCFWWRWSGFGEKGSQGFQKKRSWPSIIFRDKVSDCRSMVTVLATTWPFEIHWLSTWGWKSYYTAKNYYFP